MFQKRWIYQEEDKGGDSGNAASGVGDSSAAAGAGDVGTSAAGAGDPQGNATGVKPQWPDDWRKSIAGEDEKELKQLSRYQSPNDIWKKARALEQRISSGELKSALPKDATPEQLATWRTENGIPEKPEAYDIGVKVADEDKATVDAYLKHMHSVHASPATVKAGLEWYYKEVERVNEEQVTRDKEFAKVSEDALRAEWGNEYRTNVNQINGLLETAPADVRDEIKHGRLANGEPFLAHPAVMKWLNGLAREINPVTTIIPGAGANMANAIEDEIASIEKLMSTDRKAYNEDEKKQARLRELYGAREKMAKK